MTEIDWHGWSRNGPALHVGYLPGRKSCCLYTIDGSVLNVHAYFRSENAAKKVMALIDSLTVPVATPFDEHQGGPDA